MNYNKILFTILFFANFVLSQNITIKNNSFENNDGIKPIGWNYQKSDVSNVSIDKLNYSDGKYSLLIENNDWTQTIVKSDQVKLKVGQLYKLKAKIKTENAFTDGNLQYPTPVPACIRMESFPFTFHSKAVGATSDWQHIEVMFFATQEADYVNLVLGHNGKAKGKAWFDNIQLEEINDISEYIPPETVRWYKDAFRFDDKGWIYIHIEGEPYSRGIQYGYLIAEEIKEYIMKLSYSKIKDNPQMAWNNLRSTCDMIFLRKYDEEYLTEMKGIAEGINRAGVQLFNRNIDLIDIVTVNSYVDLDYAMDGIRKTPNALTGKSFISNEDEQELNERLHKCSGFLATKSATKDSRFVFGQLFMWNGYTGPHWNVIVDLVPTTGNRLVYQTYPGGIHSAADFYINSAGIVLGETTVGQTPFNIDGTPQSNRIRKAAQYAKSIDDVVQILTTKNNGLYTNDWLIADTKTDEIAILLLGTYKYKLWRSSKNEFYNGQKDWYWSNNNNKSLEVRKEYIANDDNAPFDLTFRPWDRDIAFWKFYEKNYGKIDAAAGLDLFNSSPINRPHACDGKLTTSVMAEKLMFFANYGKVTLREMFINENGRIPDLPGAIPRFSLGYATFSPVFIADKMKLMKTYSEIKVKDLQNNLSEVKNIYEFDKKKLWFNTVYPKSESENWFISATAGYWNMLKNIPKSIDKAFNYLRDELTELNYRYLYTVEQEKSVIPIKANTIYDGYRNFYIPRSKGIYLLHQLRLKLGNEVFSKAMNKIHNDFREKDITNEKIISIFEEISKTNLKEYFSQWLERDDLPHLTFNAIINQSEKGYTINAEIKQLNKPYKFFTTVSISTEKEIIIKLVEINEKENNFTFSLAEKPVSIGFNSGNDIPLSRKYFYTFSNFYDDFSNTLIVYGTNKQIEANHTLALRFSKTAADRFTETLIPIKKDCEITDDELKANNLILIGGISDNSLTEKIASNYGIEIYKDYFKWNGKIYNKHDDGIFLAYPNPYNSKKFLYLFIGNSTLQLYNMLKTIQRSPAYAIYKGDQIIERGYHRNDKFQIIFK